MESSVARILDTNANRAREALRVIEEFARFVLNDTSLTTTTKALRHDLASALSADPLRTIIHSRDIVRDVGRTIEADGEYHRTNARDVAVAAAKRASEALRVMEEYTKTLEERCARRFETLRYRTYELERSVAIRVAARERFADVKLYVLLTESLCANSWEETFRRTIDGGADCIQLREKSLPDDQLLERARRLAALARDAGVMFIVNDRTDIARLAGADGVHIGTDDLPVADVRRVIEPGMIVGMSTHNIEQVRAAAADSPDYIAVGPMFPTTTKPQTTVPGPPLLEAALTTTSLPLVPIGGINRETLTAVLRSGATRICVCHAVIAQPDVTNATRELKQRVCEASRNVGQ